MPTCGFGSVSLDLHPLVGGQGRRSVLLFFELVFRLVGLGLLLVQSLLLFVVLLEIQIGIGEAVEGDDVLAVLLLRVVRMFVITLIRFFVVTIVRVTVIIHSDHDDGRTETGRWAEPGAARPGRTTPTVVRDAGPTNRKAERGPRCATATVRVSTSIDS